MPEITTHEAAARRHLRRRREPTDEELAAAAAEGDPAAFARIVNRHQPKLLSFCRHTLANAEEAEDALQQTFINAHGALVGRGAPRELLPWLYAIARNCCHDIWSKRRPTVELPADLPLAGLSDPVVEREDLRELLVDLGHLPEQQRSALLLAELEGLPHQAIAAVVGCEESKVRALIFQARSTLIAERDAREESCVAIREQLAVARGGELRRGALRRHLRRCEGCQRFADDIAQQRSALRLVLPVVPSTLFLHELLSHVGIAAADTAAIGGAAAAGGALAGGGVASAGSAAAGSGAAAAGGTAAAGSAAGAAVIAKGVAILVAGAVLVGGVGLIATSSGGKPARTAIRAGTVLTPTTTRSAGTTASTAGSGSSTQSTARASGTATAVNQPQTHANAITSTAANTNTATTTTGTTAHARELAALAAAARLRAERAAATKARRAAALRRARQLKLAAATKAAGERAAADRAAVSAAAAKRVAAALAAKRATSVASGASRTTAGESTSTTTVSSTAATTSTTTTSTATTSTTTRPIVTAIKNRAGTRATARTKRKR